MTALKKIKSHPDVINYFKEPPFYNTYIEKPKIKPLKSIDFFLNFLLRRIKKYSLWL